MNSVKRYCEDDDDELEMSIRILKYVFTFGTT
jgi:hypothetical protein